VKREQPIHTMTEKKKRNFFKRNTNITWRF